MKKILMIVLLSTMLIILTYLSIVGTKGKGSSNDNNTLPTFVVSSYDVVFNKANKDAPKIKVYISKEDKIQEMNLEDYVRGVISGEMPAEFNIEAIKAQAVTARTYAAAHMEQYGGTKCNEAKGADVCDTVHCQVYMSQQQRISEWPKSRIQDYWDKITEAVVKTNGEVLTYKGKLVEKPYYFSTSSGKTENAVDVFNEDVPYLKSVKSDGDEQSNRYKTSVNIKYEYLVKCINAAYPKANLSLSNVKSKIAVLSRFSGGTVNEVEAGATEIKGSDFRSIFNLNSSNFSFEFKDNSLQVVCMGYGHDVGMSQWGANAMGKGGSSYKDILYHYYSGVDVNKLSYAK